MRTMPALAVSVLALASCTGPSVVETTLLEQEPPSDGRIVVVDDSGNVVTLDPDGSDRVELTDDGGTTRYFQPVWSPTERKLAWGVADPQDGFGVATAFDDGSSRGHVEVAAFPFYLNWSPDGARIGILRTGSSGGDLDFELIDTEAGTASIVDSGSPFYFSWSPDSDAVVVHSGGDRLQIFDESASPTDIGPTTSNYLSPRWTDDGILYLGPDGVTLRDRGGATSLLVEVEGFVSINPNPQGSLIAVHSQTRQDGLTVSLQALGLAEPNTVSIVDVASGEVDVATRDLSLGSFWSPDGASLLLLTVNVEERAVDVEVWSEGETETLVTMDLTSSLVSEALAFFDQYAQSWQMWSPDSGAVVLPGAIDGDSGIWVIPVGDGEPANVSDGQWAAWSHG